MSALPCHFAAGDAASRVPPCLYFLPEAGHRDAPLMVSVHGYTRQPVEHAVAFAPLAAARGFGLIVPLFDERHHRRYQQLAHPLRGTRSDLGLLGGIDQIAAAHGIDASRLYLFGYSGGAQFVHRFAMLHPERTAALAVGAAGWYTMPDTGAAYPRGLDGLEARFGSAADVEAFLRLPIHVWVGERDDRSDSYLRQDSGLDTAQGLGRLQRARRWTDALRAAATARGIAADVGLTVLQGQGHDFARCADAGLAAEVLAYFETVRARGADPITRSEPIQTACS